MYLGIDHSQTNQVQVGKVTYLIGSIPLGKFEELLGENELALRRYVRHSATHVTTDGDERKADIEAINACEECTRLFHSYSLVASPTHRELVRWGVRGWLGGQPETDQVDYAGVKYTVLSAALVDRISRVSTGILLRTLARLVIEANSISEDEALGFTSPSGNAPGPTGATQTAPESNSAASPTSSAN